MHWSEFENLALLARHTAPEYAVSESIQGVYPFWNSDANEGEASVVTAYRLVNSADAKSHTVVIGTTGQDEYFIWCNDNFIEGKNTKPSVETRVESAAPSMNFPKGEAMAALAMLRGRFSSSTGCHFWTKWNRDRELCKHCNQLLATLGLRNASALEKFKMDFDSRFETEVKNVAPVSAALIPTESLAKLALKTPVMLEGEKGWGKTTEARTLAEEVGATLLEIHGNESIEASDIKGYWMRYRDDFVWKDGKLTQAFRLASKGEKVLLLIDEALRIPSRHQSVFLSALSPYRGRYYLETGRIVSVDDGVGSEETLSCPEENLIVIATTNIGSQYALDEPDPAFLERFVRRRKHTDVELLRRLITEVATARGFPLALADQCCEFYTKMSSLKSQGFVNDLPNPRTLVRAVSKLADTAADVNSAVKTESLAWVGRDVEGEPVPEQLEYVFKAIDSVFK